MFSNKKSKQKYDFINFNVLTKQKQKNAAINNINK